MPRKRWLINNQIPQSRPHEILRWRSINFWTLILIYSFPEPRPKRDRSLNKVPPLCYSTKDHFVDVLPHAPSCSLVALLCSLVALSCSLVAPSCSLVALSCSLAAPSCSPYASRCSPVLPGAPSCSLAALPCSPLATSHFLPGHRFLASLSEAYWTMPTPSDRCAFMIMTSCLTSMSKRKSSIANVSSSTCSSAVSAYHTLWCASTVLRWRSSSNGGRFRV